MGKLKLDMEKYKSLARQLSAEGVVMLENKGQVLPVSQKTKTAVFGRSAFNYYKSGTGSGGLVNAAYVVSILDALKASENFELNAEVMSVYEEWIAEHPVDNGSGWASEPWYQEEMILDSGLVEAAAKESEIAMVIIGRAAGEDRDNAAVQGSYLLTDQEEDMLKKVCQAFEKVVVLLNVGNIIDMKWVEAYEPSAVLYVWQAGQEGRNAVIDVLTGAVAPSGKLSDTIAKDITDYPSTANFGGEKENLYEEDIYVGYRYFETFAKDKVVYPFGFGLSYTRFSLEILRSVEKYNTVEVDINVANEGQYHGKEVVQIYVSKPQGKLGQPAVVLAAFKKTKDLQPGECQILTFSIDKDKQASYDDSGVTGFASSYVLEAGNYQLLAGNSIRDLQAAGEFNIEVTTVVEQLEEAMAPVQSFNRIKPRLTDGVYSLVKEPVPQRKIDLEQRIKDRKPDARACTGDQGYRLADVYDQKVSMETFLNQIDDQELLAIARGEGMCSPKVTPGTASAFGGVTEELKKWGIPVGCCADGPSGIRMDCGTIAFSLPNGVSIGCSMNEELTEALFEMVGLELRKNRIDTLLGPGMNIHRNPLNGRNFEYFSEDPLITGKLAAAQLRSMNKNRVTGTIKHFIGNNQEFKRHSTNSVISERAIREIYLKGFEIAVKEGQAYSVMTTYGAVNGLWTAGNYDLNTTILRNEWGFNGIVMTDWWAGANDEGQPKSMQNLAAMVRAQNDLFMVTQDAATNADNLPEALAQGRLTRGELLRSAANICHFLIKTTALERHLGRIQDEFEADENDSNDFDMFEIGYYDLSESQTIDASAFDTTKGSTTVFAIRIPEFGTYDIAFKIKSDAGELAQIPMSVFADNKLLFTITINGTGGQWITETRKMTPFFGHNHYIKLYFGQSGMSLDTITFTLKEAFVRPANLD